MSTTTTYTDIKFSIRNKIGTITFNRPKALNSFGGNLIPDIIAALRELDNHPDTIFTVLTGEGRFFSAGADVKGVASGNEEYKNDAEKKLAYLARFNYGMLCYILTLPFYQSESMSLLEIEIIYQANKSIKQPENSSDQ
jgi:peroxisomal 3,2-trans-enoyl-CoA isomerase